ncbi:cardiac-enriched FHL2-interacting protein [Sorex araneus]|uniref:cardiac-enriched FHL2-interacting protein n=1 Tax=Sorex araneus TaxID=42254 RepID=UPI0024334513|nr:cardiac-enriched FHL2-interacting protein [Sorex araneus]
MQGNKKGTDGFSDTSSIGSVLDDADREVSSLTDRAFRSLCISEDTSFQDSDLALSPDITRQVFGNVHQGTVSHTQRKSGLWSQLPVQGTEHTGWAATLQQQPKYVQGEEKYPKSSPPLTPGQRRLEVPVSGLRNSNRPISKVSSLIKSFDSAESQHSDGRPSTCKPPAFKHPPKFAPLPESSVNFCFDSAFLTVRRVPAEVSGPHHNSLQPGRNLGEQESPSHPEAAAHSSNSFLPTPEDAASSFECNFPPPPHQPVPGEATRVPKGTFLHSENSAFESWNARQPRLLERKDVTDTVSDSKGPKCSEDTSLLSEHHGPELRVSPCQVRASCGQEEKRLAGDTLATAGPWGARDPGTQIFAPEGNTPDTQPDPPLKPTQAPWRKPKSGKGRPRGRDSQQDTDDQRRDSALYTKHHPQGCFPENGALDMPVELQDHYHPPFNISKLLTPIIPTKYVLESAEDRLVEPLPSPPGQLNGYEEKEPEENQTQDSHKPRAPSLLFILKDVRKCVKSTYSPSPLSKAQQEPMSNGVLLPNGLEDSLDEQERDGATDTPTVPHASPQKDPPAEPCAASADHHLTASSPAPAQSPFCVNGEAADRNSSEKDDTDGEPDVGVTTSGWGADSRERNPRKRLSLQLGCGGQLESRTAAENWKTPSQQEDGCLRSISQEAESQREEARLQNPNFSQKFSPGPLSPEEEDVFYSDTQSDFMPGLKSKAKFSTSSSDQSFASFEDQQKVWFVESQQEDGTDEVGSGGSGKEEEELQEGPLEDGPACTEELSQARDVMQGERESLSGGSPGKVSREEADFRDSWKRGSKDTTLPPAKVLTPSPSAASSKHLLFAIKDNTLRATPVIKPIMLPLLRTMSTEDPLGNSGGHKERGSPRPGWGEDAGLCVPETQMTPAGMRSPFSRYQNYEDQRQGPSMAGMEPAPKEGVPSPPFLVESKGMRPPSEDTPKVGVREGKSRSTEGVPDTLRSIPTIALPKGDLKDQSTVQHLGTCMEEETQDFKHHLLPMPRAGPQGRRLVSSEMAASPNASSLDESSACSPVSCSLWDDPSQAPSERTPWASPGPARLTRREDLTHALTWDPGCDPQVEPCVEELRTVSPRTSLLDLPTSLPEKAEPTAPQERAASKPPAVPPKTEKALRRAKKLASKRRKLDQMQEKHGEACKDRASREEGLPCPGDQPQPRFPAIRSLPPPVHRHSVSAFSEPINRGQPGVAQSLTPLPPYPATQKLLQDPQSGEYFLFDLPLQVKMKTFYDPETGKYVRVPIPSSEGDSPEPPPPDTLAAPYVLYPGFQALPVTALTPVRCSSQLSAPTFLRQGPLATEGACPGSQRISHAGLQSSTEPHGNPGQSSAEGGHPDGPPRGPEEVGGDAGNLNIISTTDLEDFATDGIS